MVTGDWINLGMLILTLISTIIAIGSLWFTYKEWQKIKNKIGMIDEADKASEILPAWYTSRMMGKRIGKLYAIDYWAFGLLMTDGRILVVQNIRSLSDDGKWMDVELCTKDEWSLDNNPNYIFAVAKDRTKASVQVAQIVAAMELMGS